MNYRHAYHAGNHADVLKHMVLLALIDALQRKDTPFFVLDTHAGRGRYDLEALEAGKTGEALAGIDRLRRWAKNERTIAPVLKRYLEAVRPALSDARPRYYPGSPLLVAQALREGDRLAACELQPDEAAALAALFARDRQVGTHLRDGYGAMKALLPPPEKRGLVLIDPPYEAQGAEFDTVLDAVREALQRWPQGIFALWYPIKQRRTLMPFLRRIPHLPIKNAWLAELLVRPDDSPLRMNGSGMLVLNPPWQVERDIAAALPQLSKALGEPGASHRLEWIKQEIAA
ncbi:23S rRNA (adenine(2030)-N(6))-methyltransferase RlmJ [Chiayiivirga flava]|uniref:Ribosomal RNA large subunit methyltransferase J n=1 Tax=Chiayiivirga flava TaxID=659595 RepID=A0A7W8FXZ3_9GAMM|nr:23S rRNA (adenine(2030)-N(6))-methyltransferase RlmJ [Chiayiivirga flava]MBB5206842.1 23S rRNA (adenine2030-N6)-methyltransferase [Chiayiivirga flava]